MYIVYNIILVYINHSTQNTWSSLGGWINLNKIRFFFLLIAKGWRRPFLQRDHSCRSNRPGLYPVVRRCLQIWNPLNVCRPSTIYYWQWGRDPEYRTIVAQGITKSYSIRGCLRLCYETIGTSHGQHSRTTSMRGQHHGHHRQHQLHCKFPFFSFMIPP